MKQKQRLIMGKNCLEEVLRHDPERIVHVFTVEKNAADELYQRLVRQGVAIRHVPKHQLAELANSTSHQLYVAVVKEAPETDLKDFFSEVKDRANSLVVMLDSIFDPHNIGAVLRTAECFQADLVIYSKNRGGAITPAVSKVSSGASELIPILRVSNLAETVSLFQRNDFFVVAADAASRSLPLNSFSFPPWTVLILGSEGKGVQKLMAKRSDALVKIPMLGKIDSLNVSQAAAVFLYAFRCQHSAC